MSWDWLKTSKDLRHLSHLPIHFTPNLDRLYYPLNLFDHVWSINLRVRLHPVATGWARLVTRRIWDTITPLASRAKWSIVNVAGSDRRRLFHTAEKRWKKRNYMHIYIYIFIYLFIYVFIDLFIDLFIYLLIYLSIYLFIYLLYTVLLSSIHIMNLYYISLILTWLDTGRSIKRRTALIPLQSDTGLHAWIDLENRHRPTNTKSFMNLIEKLWNQVL